ncbi:hypothetical protein GCM10028773_33450 [Spirosoma koreense]
MSLEMSQITHLYQMLHQHFYRHILGGDRAPYQVDVTLKIPKKYGSLFVKQTNKGE